MRTNRYLIAALLISVALNLIVAGIFSGRAFRPDPELRHLDPMLGLRRLVHDLPEDRAEVLAPYYRAYFRALRPRFREIRAAQGSLRDAILADPLVEEALEQALLAFNKQISASQGSAVDALVALTTALTPAERRQLVTHLSRSPLSERERRGARRPGKDRLHPPEQHPDRQLDLPPQQDAPEPAN